MVELNGGRTRMGWMRLIWYLLDLQRNEFDIVITRNLVIYSKIYYIKCVHNQESSKRNCALGETDF